MAKKKLPEGLRELLDEEFEQSEKPLPPPLVEPIFVDDVVMDEFFRRYNIFPLAPISRFEYQIVQVAAALEKRVRELDPDL